MAQRIDLGRGSSRAAPGVFFTLQPKRDLQLMSLTFKAFRGGTFTLHRCDGAASGKEEQPGLWTQVSSVSGTERQEATFALESPLPLRRDAPCGLFIHSANGSLDMGTETTKEEAIVDVPLLQAMSGRRCDSPSPFTRISTKFYPIGHLMVQEGPADVQGSVAERVKQELRKAMDAGGSSRRGARNMFVGAGRAGKTSTVKSLLGQEFNACEESTIGADTQKCEISRQKGVIGWQEQGNESEMVRVAIDLACRGADALAGNQDLGSPNLDRPPSASGAANASQATTSEATTGVVKRSGESSSRTSEASERPSTAPSGQDSKASKGQTKRLDAIDEEEVARRVGNIKFSKEGMEEDKLTFNIWAFRGQHVFYTLHHLFMSRFGVYVVCFRAPDVALKDVASLQALHFWLRSVRLHADGAPVILVGTRLDEMKAWELQRVSKVLEEHVCPSYSHIVVSESQVYSGYKFFPFSNVGERVLRILASAFTLYSQASRSQHPLPQNLLKVAAVDARALHSIR